MYRSRVTNWVLGLFIAAALATNGCMFVPRWARLSGPDRSHPARLAAAAESFDQIEAEAPPTVPEVALARDEDGTLQSQSARATLPENSQSPVLKAFIAELEEYPEIDLADRNQLLQQLHQTEPDLLEAVVRQYRANLTFQRQRREKEKERELALTKSTAEAARAEPKDKPEKPVNSVDLAAVGIAIQSALPGPPDKQGSSGKPAVGPPRLSIAARLLSTNRSSAGEPDGKPESQVVAAAFVAKPPADWRDQLNATVEALKSSVNQTPDSPEEISDHVRLRLLCLAAQQRDEALRPIPTLDSNMTEFWNKEVFGLATLLDTEMFPDPTQRMSEAKIHLVGAVNRLGESAPLVVRNLAFITKVVSYGVYTTFESYEFTPGQRVGLYVEMENFTSKEGPQGFHTSLKSSYEITDNRGQRVAVKEFLPNRETCRNRRRDYFIYYEIDMPERIYPGEYTLQLTVTDDNSEKVGQSKIQFYISEQ